MSTFRRVEKDQNMSEQQHPFVEHESALEDTVKLPVVKPQNNRPNAHSHASTPRTPQEEQVSVLQPASNGLGTVNRVHDPEIDESLAPTLKIPALKKSRPQLSERQTPPALATLEQEEPIAASAYSPVLIAQQLDKPVTIADDYDFSEMDIDMVDIISYGLFSSHKKLATIEQEIIAINTTPSLSSAGPTGKDGTPGRPQGPLPTAHSPVGSTATSITVSERAEFITFPEAHMTTEDAHHTESAINVVPAEDIAETESSLYEAEIVVDVETAQADGDVQTHIEDQSPSVEQEVLSITSDVSPSSEPDTSQVAENVTDDTATVSIEQEPEPPIISSSSPLEESTPAREAREQDKPLTEEITKVPDIPFATSLEENRPIEETQDERLSGDLDSTTPPDASLSSSVDEGPYTEEPLTEPADTSATLNTPVEESLPVTSVDTLPPALIEEYVETEQTVGEEEVASEPLVVVETPLTTQEPVEDSAEAALPVETEIDTADVVAKPASVESLPVSTISKQPASETQIVVRQRRKHTLSRRAIVSLILLVLFVISAILAWRELTSNHVYLNALDPNTGKVQTQQDLGSYQDPITLTAPVSESSQLYVGIRSDDQQGTQQVMSLRNTTNSWSVTAQFVAPLAHGSLSGTADGHLFAVGANSLQVIAVDSHALWSLQGEQPSQGTHPYQPISDGQTLYAVASLKQSQVAAYDLQRGTRQWVQTLDDTLDDAPPFALDENTLYIASDHKLYALNSIDGSLRWKKAYPSRTLLIENEGKTQLLLAVGTQGLIALNPVTGALVWAFNGQPGDTFTAAQFYQAAIASTGEANSNVVYATGIVWQLPQIQEQVWLYAINATTGTLRWSQQVGTGYISADAGRVLPPLIDPRDRTVVLQQQLNNHKQRITAFDSNTGRFRWSTLMAGITGSSPALALAPNGTLILFTTAADSRKVLLTPSLMHIIEIVIFALLLIGLLFSTAAWLRICFSYLQRYSKQFPHFARTLQRYALSPFQRFTLLSPLSRTLVIVLVLSILGGGTWGYALLNQPQNALYQVATLNGDIQWQQRITTPTQTLTTDAEGSVITTSVGDHLRQLQALTRNGTVQWKTFSSQGIFSAPTIASPPGTIVVELRGDTAPPYQFAPADVAYPSTINHLLVLYVLNRSTGIPLWQHILVYPDEQQHAVILGADGNYIYVSSTQIHPAPESKGATLQLFAVNRTTGTIDWRVFGPTEPSGGPHDDGQLLLKEGRAIWQVAGTIYAIDTVVGQIEWRRQIADDDLSVLVQEDRMTEAAGALLIMRRHRVHGLDPNTGNELWTLPAKGASTPHSLAGVAVVGQTILAYGNGQIEAFDVIDRHSLWRHIEFNAIEHLSISDDKKTVYLIEVSNLADTAPALVALNVQTGTTQWTFEPAREAMFPFTSPDSFLSGNSLLFVTVCFPFGQDSCAHERLYALATETGKPVWTFTGYRFSDLHLSQDGKTLLFSVNTNVWVQIWWSV